jgi:hypothetical protein
LLGPKTGTRVVNSGAGDGLGLLREVMTAMITKITNEYDLDGQEDAAGEA